LSLFGSFSRLKSIEVLLIGDFMLDTYTMGQTERISPEAPVPVLHVREQKRLPGGAGNVVCNLLALGASVSVVGRIGDDEGGAHLTQILKDEGASIEGLVKDPEAVTPIKNRLIAGGQQLMRLDTEETHPLNAPCQKAIERQVDRALKTASIVAISDYNKGLLTPDLLKVIIAKARKKGIPVLVDPKGDDFSKYAHATLIKPNLKEAYAAAKLPKSSPLDEVAKELLSVSKAEMILITRSEEGLSLFTREGARRDFPVTQKEVVDVTGAGDTVLALLTMALGSSLKPEKGCELANVAAGIAIEHIGCAKITLKEIGEALFRLDGTQKIFKRDHLFVLKHILENHPFTLLGLETQEALTAPFCQALHKLAKNPGPLIVTTNAHDEILTHLEGIDYIIEGTKNLAKLCKELTPEHVYLYENAHLMEIHPDDLCLRMGI